MIQRLIRYLGLVTVAGLVAACSATQSTTPPSPIEMTSIDRYVQIGATTFCEAGLLSGLIKKGDEQTTMILEQVEQGATADPQATYAKLASGDPATIAASVIPMVEAGLNLAAFLVPQWKVALSDASTYERIVVAETKTAAHACWTVVQ